MTRFTFDVEFYPDEVIVHGLSQGHIIVDGGLGQHSSKETQQPMMLLPSISELLNSVSSFLTSRKGSQMTFSGDDSSFVLRFVRRQEGLVAIYGGAIKDSSIIDQVSPMELVKALQQGVSTFLEGYNIQLVDVLNRASTTSNKTSSADEDIVTVWENDIWIEFWATLHRFQSFSS